MTKEDKERLEKLRETAIHFLNKAETTEDLIIMIKGMAGMINFTERFGRCFFKDFIRNADNLRKGGEE